MKFKVIVSGLFILLALCVLGTAMLGYANMRYTSQNAVLNYIRQNPADIAVACFDPAKPAAGFYHNAGEAYPLASTFKIVILLAYAEQVHAGVLDPAEQIPLTALEAYYLPDTDGDAHPEFLKSLGEARASLSLAEVVEGMMTYSSNAASDYLLARLAGFDWPGFYQRLGLEQTSLPHSYLGLYLYMTNHETGTYDLTSLGPEATLAEQVRLEGLFVNDLSWREAELRYAANFTNRAPLDVQKDVTANFGVHASATDLGRLMTAIYGADEILAPRVREIARQYLEWPMRLNPDNAKTFRVLAVKNGAWPAVLTSAWYADPLEAEPLVLVVFYRNMPDDFWNAWVASFSQQMLEVDVLTESDCSLLSQALEPASP
jgi:D-alanyl-D-alanine carboxypeptidase